MDLVGVQKRNDEGREKMEKREKSLEVRDNGIII